MGLKSGGEVLWVHIVARGLSSTPQNQRRCHFTYGKGGSQQHVQIPPHVQGPARTCQFLLEVFWGLARGGARLRTCKPRGTPGCRGGPEQVDRLERASLFW